MDINILDILSYVNPLVLGICLCLGHVIKYSIPVLPNKFIPLIMGVCGVAMTVALGWPFGDAESVLTAIYSGFVSGLASTGLHQAFSNLISSNGTDNADKEDSN